MEFWPHQWQCYKVSSKWKGDKRIDFQKLKVQLTFNFNETSDKNTASFAYAYLWFTSERNSYGLAGERWFEGRLDKILANLDHKYSIAITKVTDYNNMNGFCSEDSYHECLAKRFRSPHIKRYYPRIGNDSFHCTSSIYFTKTWPGSPCVH